MDTFSLILVRHRMIFGSTEYSQLNETEPYCTCGRIDTCLNLPCKGREERTSQLCIRKNWMFKARPAIRCDGLAASGTEMSPWHVQRGTFCEVSIIRYGSNVKHIPSLCCHKTQLVFKTKYHNQIISTHWNIACVLNHPTEQSF